MSNLLIIGNGFDLQLGLKSKYSDFFNYLLKNNIDFKKCYDYIFNLNHFTGKLPDEINTWYALLIAYNQNENEYQWKDIEKIIYSFLVSKIENYDVNFDNIYDKINYYIKAIYDFPVNTRHSYPRDNKFISLICNNLEKSIFYKLNKDKMELRLKTEIYSILLSQLNVLENDFALYLKNEFENFDYNKKSEKLFADLIFFDSLLTDSYGSYNDIRKNTYILSFNYTYPKRSKYSLLFKNIHGSLKNSNENNIIFGIDQLNSKIDPKSELYKFTKAYRVAIIENKNLKNNQLNLIDTEKIIIYGHSLNEQDQNYYFSIFNLLNINTNNKIKIHYYYNNHDSLDTSINNVLMLHQLLIEYEDKFGIPKGLYTRMYFENRILIRELKRDPKLHIG